MRDVYAASQPLYSLPVADATTTITHDVITALDAYDGVVYVGTRRGQLLRLVVDGLDALAADDDDDDDDSNNNDDDDDESDCDTTGSAKAAAPRLHTTLTAHAVASTSSAAAVMQLRLLPRHRDTATSASPPSSSSLSLLLFVLCGDRLAVWHAATLTRVCDIADTPIAAFDVAMHVTRRAVAVVCAAVCASSRIAVFELDDEGDSNDDDDSAPALRALLWQEFALREPAQSLVLLQQQQQQQQQQQVYEEHDGSVVCAATRNEYVLLSLDDGTTCGVLPRDTSRDMCDNASHEAMTNDGDDDDDDDDGSDAVASASSHRPLLARDGNVAYLYDDGDVYALHADAALACVTSAAAAATTTTTATTATITTTTTTACSDAACVATLRPVVTLPPSLSLRRDRDGDAWCALCVHSALVMACAAHHTGAVVSMGDVCDDDDDNKKNDSNDNDNDDNDAVVMSLPPGRYMALIRDSDMQHRDKDSNNDDDDDDDSRYACTRSVLCVASATQLWLVVLPSLRRQLRRLVARDRVDAAVALAAAATRRIHNDISNNNDDTSRRRLGALERAVQRMAGFAQLRRGRVADAVARLVASGVDVRELLLHVRECVPPSPDAYSPELRRLLATRRKSNDNSSDDDDDDDALPYWHGWHRPCRYNTTAAAATVDTRVDAADALVACWRDAYATQTTHARMTTQRNAGGVTAYVRRTWSDLKLAMLHHFRRALAAYDDEHEHEHVHDDDMRRSVALRARAMSYALLVLLLESRDYRGVYALVARAPRRAPSVSSCCCSRVWLCDAYDLLCALREYRLLALLLHRCGCAAASSALLRRRVLLSSYCPRMVVPHALRPRQQHEQQASLSQSVASHVRAQTRWWFDMHTRQGSDVASSSSSSLLLLLQQGSQTRHDGVVGAGLLRVPHDMRALVAVQLLHMPPPPASPLSWPHGDARDDTTTAATTWKWLQHIAAQVAERAAAVAAARTGVASDGARDDATCHRQDAATTPADTPASCAEVFYLVDKADVTALRDVLLPSSLSSSLLAHVRDDEGSTLLHVALGLLLRHEHDHDNNNNDDDARVRLVLAMLVLLVDAGVCVSAVNVCGLTCLDVATLVDDAWRTPCVAAAATAHATSAAVAVAAGSGGYKRRQRRVLDVVTAVLLSAVAVRAACNDNSDGNNCDKTSEAMCGA